MIALRVCDSRTGLIPPDQKAVRLSFLRRRSLSRPSQPCEGLPAAVLLIHRSSIMVKWLRCLQFNILNRMCQYNSVKMFKKQGEYAPQNPLYFCMYLPIDRQMSVCYDTGN